MVIWTFGLDWSFVTRASSLVRCGSYAQVHDGAGRGVVLKIELVFVDAGDDEAVDAGIFGEIHVAGAGAGEVFVAGLLEMEVVEGDAEGGIVEEGVGGDVFGIAGGVDGRVIVKLEAGGGMAEEAAVFGFGVGEVGEAIFLALLEEVRAIERCGKEMKSEEIGAGKFGEIGGEAIVDVIDGAGAGGGAFDVFPAGEGEGAGG